METWYTQATQREAGNTLLEGLEDLSTKKKSIAS